MAAPAVTMWDAEKYLDISHADDGCHRHPDGIVSADWACCICDAEEPCQGAIDRAFEYMEAAFTPGGAS